MNIIALRNNLANLMLMMGCEVHNLEDSPEIRYLTIDELADYYAPYGLSKVDLAMVGGCFDPNNNVLIIRTDLQVIDNWQELALMHELVHSLQSRDILKHYANLHSVPIEENIGDPFGLDTSFEREAYILSSALFRLGTVEAVLEEFDSKLLPGESREMHMKRRWTEYFLPFIRSALKGGA